MVKLTGVFSQLSRRKVMVIGDFMLDTYTIGKARRISPEAPVAVVHVQRQEHRPGGAGNVVLNLVSLGADVVAVGRIGDDHAGKHLREILLNEHVDGRGLLVQESYDTPVKNRILADNQQVVRVDHEIVTPINQPFEQQMIQMLPALLEEVTVVAISDYGKGFLSKNLLQSLIQHAKKRGIPVIADPKGVDFTKYHGATVIKPNLGEAYAAANLLPDASLEQVAERILQSADAETLMITRSEAGISLFHKNGDRHDLPVRVREVKDVTGAGDTVLAMLTCGLANELSIVTAAQLSNVAAGIAIERFGCARISLEDLALRLLEDDATNKVFDDEHLFALQQVLMNKNFCLLSLNSKEGMNSAAFKIIKKLSQEGHGNLVVYIRDNEPEPEFISLLASIHEVKFILLKGKTLQSLFLTLSPQGTYILEKGQCTALRSVQELVDIS